MPLSSTLKTPLNGECCMYFTTVTIFNSKGKYLTPERLQVDRYFIPAQPLPTVSDGRCINTSTWKQAGKLLVLLTGKAPASSASTVRDTHTSKLPCAALFSDRILRVGSPGPQRLSLVQQLREKEDLLAAAPTEAPGRKTLVGLLSVTRHTLRLSPPDWSSKGKPPGR